MIKVELTYSDGKKVIKTFDTQKQADWYIHNEGDHLIRVKYL